MQEKKQSPNYYAILTSEVRYDRNLKANEKLLYAEITALTNFNGVCWATNKYFSQLYGVSPTSISKWIGNLITRGYIKSEIVYEKNKIESTRRYITIVKGGIEEKLKTPIEEKLNLNSTSTNNKKNRYIISKDPYKLLEYKDFKEWWLDFIEVKKKRKGAMSCRVMTLQYGKLFKLANGNKEKALQILTNSVNGGWSDFYALKDEKKKPNYPSGEETVTSVSM